MRRLLTAFPLFVLVTACGRGDASQSVASNALTVRKGDLIERVVLTGEVEARRGLMTAVPKLPNWETTIKWIAEDGTVVREGDRVVELDNSSFSTTIEQKRIAVTEANQQLAKHDASARKILEEKIFDVDRRKIELDGIKRIGRFSIPVHVFEGVTAEVKTLVVPEGGELPPEEELLALEAAERAEAEAAEAAHAEAMRATEEAIAEEEAMLAEEDDLEDEAADEREDLAQS